jgi:glycosyltransferase involved in cell wall biosynthesis
MKILIVTHYFLPHVGGIEIVAYNQAKELVKRGHEVTIISSRIGNEPEREVMDGIRIIRVKSLNIFEEKYGIPYPVYSPKILFTLNKEVKKADIVHLHECFYLPSFVASIFSVLNKKPYIIMQHVEPINTGRIIVTAIQNLFYYTYGKFILDKSKKILVCNDKAGKSLNRPEKTIFLPNAVDTKIFKPRTERQIKVLRKKYDLPINKKIVLFAGRFVPKKGFDKVYKAKSADYLILFVGGGIIPPEIKKDRDVEFLPFLDQKELSEVYALSDIFILPSVNEGFPLTILEAMACGLPIITTDHPGYDLYLNRKFVELIKPEVEVIRSSIKKVLSNSNKLKEMSSYSLKEVKNRFSWEKNVNNLLNIYEQALKEHASKNKQK